jgi:hypothetical protein
MMLAEAGAPPLTFVRPRGPASAILLVRFRSEARALQPGARNVRSVLERAPRKASAEPHSGSGCQSFAQAALTPFRPAAALVSRSTGMVRVHRSESPVRIIIHRNENSFSMVLGKTCLAQRNQGNRRGTIGLDEFLWFPWVRSSSSIHRSTTLQAVW